LLEGGSITSNRGRLVEHDKRFYFLTVHPAAIIYNPELKTVFRSDLVNLVNELKKLEANRGSTMEDYL